MKSSSSKHNARDDAADVESGCNSKEAGEHRNWLDAAGHNLSMRIIYADMQPREINTKQTVAAILLGADSRVEHFLFIIGVKDRIATSILWSLWYIGALVGMLCVARVLPTGYVWASLLMLPLPIITVFLLSWDLLTICMNQFDLYIILILQFAFLVDALSKCHMDQRVVFWWCFLPTMVASGVVDAYPAKYRSFFAILFFSAMLVILIVWNLLLLFHWETFGDPTKSLNNLAFSLHHMSDQLTLGVLYARHVYSSVFTSDYFVLIKADVLTGRPELEYHSASVTAADLLAPSQHSHIYITHHDEVVMCKDLRTESSSGVSKSSPLSQSKSPPMTSKSDPETSKTR